MQAAYGVTSVRSCPPPHFSNGAGYPNRNGSQKTNYGASGRCNDFLNTSLAPIAPARVIRDYDGQDCNYITQENYLFLRDSYFRYASLLGREARHRVGKSIGESIVNLYNEMETLIGDNLNVNIENRKEKLCFTLWKQHQWGNYSLYWLPVKFVEKLPAQLRRIVISFLYQLLKSNGLYAMNNMDDVEFLFEWIEDMAHEEDEPDRKEKLALIESYRGGKIYRLLARTEKKCYYKHLSAAFDKYVPRNDFERSLLDLMREGLCFIGDDKPAIRGYEYDPEYEEDPDSRPLSLDRQIRVIYDNNDYITESMIESFNCDLQETYELIPITTLDLSPETQELFAMDDYPERFFRWADKFIYLIP